MTTVKTPRWTHVRAYLPWASPIQQTARPGQPDVSGSAFMYDPEKKKTAPSGRDLCPTVKYDLTDRSAVVLVPQPTDDPLDPLNWPLWQRDWILLVLTVAAMVSTMLVMVTSSITPAVAHALRVSRQDVYMLTAWHLLATGLSGFVIVPAAKWYGKRTIYLAALGLVALSSILCGALSGSYQGVLACRILQGLGIGPFESLIHVSVNDLFFVHQRGKRMAMTIMGIYGGLYLSPVLSTAISDWCGYKWCFYIAGIVLILLFPLFYLFVPETGQARPSAAELAAEAEAEAGLAGRGGRQPPPRTYQPRRVSWWELAARPARADTDRSTVVWKLAVRPGAVLLHPVLAWATTVQGLSMAVVTVMSIAMQHWLTESPYHLPHSEVGLLFTGPFFGGLIGYAVVGVFSDSAGRYMARKNGGVFEPEFRLSQLVLLVVLSFPGIYGFGYAIDNPDQLGYVWPAFFFGVMIAAIMGGFTAAASFIGDGHGQVGLEGYTSQMMVRNVLGCGLVVAGGWVMVTGNRFLLFYCFSCVLVIWVAGSGALFFVYGKRLRALFDERGFFETLKLV